MQNDPENGSEGTMEGAGILRLNASAHAGRGTPDGSADRGVFLVYGKSGVGPVKDINEFRRGLNAAAAELRLGDRAAIVHTASESMIDLPMTDDLAKVGHTIAFGKYRMGYDHLYDAVHVATTLFIRPNDLSRRRAILAITDDVERGSKTGIEPLITEILEADATLNEVICVWGTRSHEVGLGGVWGIPRVSRTIGTPRDGDSLSAATQATGGEAVPGDQFREQLPALVRRLRMRYLLGFYAEPSLQTQKEFRPIEVRLTPDAQKRYPNARIRVRRGYYAEPH